MKPRMTGASLITTPEMRLVLEAGACANDLEWAHFAVDAAAPHAWGFKVQMYQAPRLVTRWATTYGDRTLNEPSRQWDAFADSLPYEAWLEVKEHCDEVGLTFLASVFDEQAVEASEAMGMSVYKIASADITHRPLLEAVRQTGKPVILSTGASYLWEVERALEWLNGDVTVLACTLHYPAEWGEANMARMRTLSTLSRNVGYSDHTRGVEGILAAREFGACMVEKHYTITKELGSGDHAFAVDPEDLEGWRDRTVDDDTLAVFWGDDGVEPKPWEMEARTKARRSIVARKVIQQGQTFRWDNLDFLRPGGGLEPWQAYGLVGRKAQHGYFPGEQIAQVEAV